MLYFGRWKVISILAVILVGALFALPNIVPESVRYEMTADGERALDANGEPLPPRFPWNVLPHQSVNLGLDLQGGAHLVFEVDLAQVQRDRIDVLRDDAAAVLGEAPRIVSRGFEVVDGGLVVTISRPDDSDAAFERLSDLSEPISNEQGFATLDQTLNVSRVDGDPRSFRLEFTDAYYADIQNRTVDQSINVIRRRLDGTGTSEPVIARQGDNRVLVQVPGASDPQEIIDVVAAAARLEFRMVAPPNVQSQANYDPTTCEGLSPPRMEILATDNPFEPCLVVEQRVRLTGDNLQSASSQQQDGQPVVAFRFDRQGSLIFGELTSQNVGRRFAAILDNRIVSAPNIETPILQGSGIIRGSFTFEEVNTLVVQLNAGALPATLTAVEQRTVGPGLGQDAIDAGQVAIMVGFAGVILFMLLAYGLFGGFATLSLLINVVLIVGALSMLRATLTLPGIAGIILTIGMAVDANVLIFERIREESRLGRSIANALEAGYSRALSAILDANITTLIAAFVLIILGAGPVRGFAITLGIGIITSVFTAFVFSRLMAVVWLRGFKPKSLPI